MDPLSQFLDDLKSIKVDCDQLEAQLTECEERVDFMENNTRYIRLCGEKDLLIKHLCDVRMALCKRAVDIEGNAVYALTDPDSSTSYHIGKVTTQSGDSTAACVSLGVASVSCDSNDNYGNNDNSGSRDNYSDIQPDAPMEECSDAVLESGQIGATVSIAQVPEEPPAIMSDVAKYQQDKSALKATMRDFTEKKIHFIGMDGHIISVQEYQGIRQRVKAGEDEARIMQGATKIYRTGYNKTTNSYTENRLFLPAFRTYASTGYGRMIAAATAAGTAAQQQTQPF